MRSRQLSPGVSFRAVSLPARSRCDPHTMTAVTVLASRNALCQHNVASVRL
jgi:hypothetical protein